MIRKRLVRFETKRKISFPLPFVILLLCITVHITHVTLSSWRVFHHSSRGLEILWTQDLSSCRDYPQGAAPVEALSKQSDPCKSSSDLVPCSSTNLSSYVMLTIWKQLFGSFNTCFCSQGQALNSVLGCLKSGQPRLQGQGQPVFELALCHS